jgi:predicted TPR repeat methyltransferase
MNPQIQVSLHQAVQAFRIGNFDGADSILKGVLQNDANGADAIFELGIAYAKANRFIEASAVFCCLQPFRKDDARIPYNLGLIHSLQGKHQLALAAYDLALKIQPDDAEVLINKGSTCNDIKNYVLALEVLEKAIQIRPDIPEAWSNKGIALNNLNSYQESINAYNEAIRLAPSYHEAWSNKCAPLNKLKRFLEASEACDKALSLKPDYAEAWTNKGITLNELKRYDEAIAHYDKALSLKPDYAEAWTNKGITLNELKRYDEAIAHYDKALSLKPDHAEAWSLKGVALHTLKCYNEAIAHYDKALSLKPDYAEAWSSKGITLNELKRYDEAIAHYDKALSFKPCEASFFYQKSFTNIALNQYAIAVENLEDAIKYKFSPEGYAEYMLSALRPENGLKPMPKNYVAELFDGYANSFDKHLIDTLKYETPKNLLELLNPSINDKFTILDLGCGTGLMGKLLKPYASKIVGVDLSKEMLSKAELTGAYDKLIEDDILEFLSKCNDKFDLVVSADVFIYIGELSGIFMGLADVLKTGGLFCFSVEKNDSIKFSLSPKTLRYSHSKEYIQKLASLHNFKIQNILERPIRQENHVDVDGHCFLLKKVYQ